MAFNAWWPTRSSAVRYMWYLRAGEEPIEGQPGEWR